MAVSAVDEVWTLLEERKSQSVEEIAGRTGLPARFVEDVLLFLARYGFIKIAYGSGTVVELYEDAPPISMAIRIVSELVPASPWSLEDRHYFPTLKQYRQRIGRARSHQANG